MNVATIPDTDTRARMVMDRLEYEADPDGFGASVELEQQALRDKLIAATDSLKQVRAPCLTSIHSALFSHSCKLFCNSFI